MVFHGARTAVSYLGMAASSDLVPMTLESTNKDRKNDINMQKIPTVYCFEVEAVVGGGGGLIPSKRSCPLILLISRSKLI